jgi:O-methyltransferase
MVWLVIRNSKRIPSFSTWQQHLVLVEAILRVPADLEGDVVECGCYGGCSTANLSLACSATGRKLIVCDSFMGLPEVHEKERYEINAGSVKDYFIWEKGDFGIPGGQDVVVNNVRMYGELEVCRFVKGFFRDTLKDIESELIVMVFEDADLKSSIEDCIKYLWPKMQEGCKFFSHEPWSVHAVSLFYDEKWWAENMGTQPPGFDGSGRGILVGMDYSNIGYAKKYNAEKIREQGKERQQIPANEVMNV